MLWKIGNKFRIWFNQEKEQVDDQEIISNSEDELHILAHKLKKLICKYGVTI
jgi:hypothetical protein